MRQLRNEKHTRNDLPGILFLMVVFVGIDQFTKKMAQSFLFQKEDLVLWKNIFSLHYLENQGAAFGIFQNQKWMFIVFFLILFAGAVFFYYKTPHTSFYRPLFWVIAMILSGGLGNAIDRIFYGYVIDFFYFEWINFPVFNVADIYVVLGTILLCLLLCFHYQEEDFNYFRKRGNI